VAQTEELEYPPVLAEREIDRLLRDQARAAGHDVEHFVEQLNKPAQEIRDTLRPTAEERVRRSLALTALAEAEQIMVEPAEVDAEIEGIVNSSGAQASQMRQLFQSPGGREAIERSILTRKTSDGLVEIVSGPKRAAKAAAKRTGKQAAAGKRKPKAVQAAEEERT
jgi:trigger factor